MTVNGASSDWKQVTSGIPQGSVLGPMLFVVYINDLPEEVNSEAYLFADDTKVYRQITSDADTAELQQDLDSLQNWSDTWLLKFHPDKCVVMSVGNSDKQAEYTMGSKDGKCKLKHSDCEKDIGVHVDTKLNFQKHISTSVNKANRIMGLIRRTYTYLDEHNFLMLFKALVRPHLEYANAVWHPVLKKDIEIVEKVQRRATKLIPSLQNLSYEERLRKLKLPSLVYRRLRGDMVEVYKIVNQKYDPDVANFLPRNQDTRTRGHKLKLKKAHAHSNLRLKFFSMRVVNTWNDLPEEVVTAPSLQSFERRLDKVWKNHPVLYDYTADIAHNGSDLHRAEVCSDNELDTEATIA